MSFAKCTNPSICAFSRNLFNQVQQDCILFAIRNVRLLLCTTPISQQFPISSSNYANCQVSYCTEDQTQKEQSRWISKLQLQQYFMHRWYIVSCLHMNISVMAFYHFFISCNIKRLNMRENAFSDGYLCHAKL